MIASDLNNPNFVGASNPDSRLMVQFYKKAVKQEFMSEQEKRPIFADMDFVKIWTPGDQLSIIDTPVREDHKQRFPIQWSRYQNSVSADTKEIGTPLKEWPILTPSMVEELRALKFYTVESIANASDVQLQSIGMIAGKSVFSFRDDAQKFLFTSKMLATEGKSQHEMDELRNANSEAMKKIAELTELVTKLAAPQEPKKRGRKPKNVEV